MTDLEFSKKPRRMTSPPQNQRKWLPGYEGVEVKLETHPGRVAYFAREATWGDIMAEPTEEEYQDTLAEVATGKVLSAAMRGPGFGFRIRASRSCMDQMLRLAEGSGGAGSGAGAQTTRDNDQREFNIIVPNTIEALRFDPATDQHGPVASRRDELHMAVEKHVEASRKLYGQLVDAGVPPQDARYVALPLGFQTQWMHIMDLRALVKLCEQRLCNGLTQHETNYLVRLMRDEVVKFYPWTDKLLRSSCEKQGKCASRTMLFPPCGAFSGAGISEVPPTHRSQYREDDHLYSDNQNDAMQFADWDWERNWLEEENPSKIFSFVSQGPEAEGHRVVLAVRPDAGVEG